MFQSLSVPVDLSKAPEPWWLWQLWESWQSQTWDFPDGAFWSVLTVTDNIGWTDHQRLQVQETVCYDI
jgi:hypothetical protein